MEALIIGSLLTSFVAGIAALFAPCCISVLLPSYLGSLFSHRGTILAMTGVFFLGLASIFVPLGMGFGALGSVLQEFHDPLYYTGGSFLLLLGISLLLGYHWNLPMVSMPSAKLTGILSVYLLGIFSAVATLCCAPVLAGAMALSVLPGSVLWGALYSLFYAGGMIIPLVAIASILDRTKAMEKINILKKRIYYTLFWRRIELSFSDLASGILFFFMGLFIIYLAATGQLRAESDSQMELTIGIAQFNDWITQGISQISLLEMIAALVAVVISIGAIVLWRWKNHGTK